MNPLLEEARLLRAKKDLGQHFLVDQPTLAHTAQLAVTEPDQPVLEIGPGPGFLTQFLLQAGAIVTAVELDPRMVRYLHKKFRTQPNLTVVQGDILHYPGLADFHGAIAGNIPYQITAPLLRVLCGSLSHPNPARFQVSRITLLVQREVAERLAATPGHKAYNPLTIATQLWYDVALHRHVPARLFVPPPKVESAVITLTPRPEPRVTVADWARYERVVKTAFSQRRKKLRNTLPQTELVAAGIDPDLRPEALSIEDFARLC
jgi:16S rRNA (adenine1518-N6/adenine1519-N6)-dimethyltransferase